MDLIRMRSRPHGPPAARRCARGARHARCEVTRPHDSYTSSMVPSGFERRWAGMPPPQSRSPRRQGSRLELRHCSVHNNCRWMAPLAGSVPPAARNLRSRGQLHLARCRRGCIWHLVDTSAPTASLVNSAVITPSPVPFRACLRRRHADDVA